MPQRYEDRIAGALCGLALGDAIGRPVGGLSPDAVSARQRAAPRALVHGAATSWTLATLDALLYRRHDEPLAADLALRLCILARPLGGRALRGAATGLARTLFAVAARLEAGEDPRLVGSEAVRAEGILVALPLAFALGDDDEDVAAAVVEAVTLTHRHTRVVGAAAMWVGGLRAILRRPRASLEARLEAGLAFARRALVALTTARAGLVIGRPLEAEGALALARAEAAAAPEATALLAPAGMDGRDAPERLVAAALRFAGEPEADLDALFEARSALGGDADVSLPLLAATRGLGLGEERLPLGLLSRLATRPMLEARAAALFDVRPPRIVPLVDDELRISRRLERDEDPALPRPPAARKRGEQLKLL